MQNVKQLASNWYLNATLRNLDYIFKSPLNYVTKLCCIGHLIYTTESQTNCKKNRIYYKHSKSTEEIYYCKELLLSLSISKGFQWNTPLLMIAQQEQNMVIKSFPPWLYSLYFLYFQGKSLLAFLFIVFPFLFLKIHPKGQQKPISWFPSLLQINYPLSFHFSPRTHAHSVWLCALVFHSYFQVLTSSFISCIFHK